ncbi:MAG: DGQHR domain-containing protein [Geobacter sp.]
MKCITSINGLIGISGGLPVFMGFEGAATLIALSFPDALNEDTGEGYQRPYNKAHSLDFKNYITRPGSSTPPLTFNLRNEYSDSWSIERGEGNAATLIITNNVKCLAQVDCQHRLGELKGIDVPLAFMTYIGLDLRQEMAIFNVINSKAKGLSSSLTDYHESKLLNDLAAEAPHLFISRRLNEDLESPWYRLIRYGGETTSGLKRRTSFRMMQKTVQSFLSQTKSCLHASLEDKYQIVLNFWVAVKNSFPEEWQEHRNNLITKGVGLYGLMQIMGDLVKQNPKADFSVEYFEACLAPLKSNFDWSSHGRFAYVGGKKGVQDVYLALKKGVQL